MQHEFIKLLIHSAQRGRKNAFIDLCEMNMKNIFTLCVRLLADKRLSKQISIEIFTQAWENIRFVRDDSTFDAWLKGIAVYTILDEIRTRERTKEFENSSASDEDEAVETENQLESLIIALPENERVTYILHDIEGYSYSEISDFLHEMSEEEIQSSVKQTRRKLIESTKNGL